MSTAANADPEAKLLSYNGTLLLRRADVSPLHRPGEWLNDQLVAFWFSWLVEEAHPSLASRVCLMPGGTSFLLLHSDPSEARLIFEALGLQEQELVVFAVNDNPDVQHAAGGSHWSCLAYHRPTNSFRHYDSSRPHNRSTARQLAGAAAPLVRSRQQPDGGSSAPAAAQLPAFVEVQAMPQQDNGADCGLFACAAAQALCELMHSSSSEGADDDFEQRERTALQSISSAGVAQLRQQMLGLIEQRIAVAAAAEGR